MCSMEGTWDGRGTDSEGRFHRGGGGHKGSSRGGVGGVWVVFVLA